MEIAILMELIYTRYINTKTALVPFVAINIIVIRAAAVSPNAELLLRSQTEGRQQEQQ